MTLEPLRRRAGAFLVQPGVAILAKLGISPNTLSLLGLAGNLGAAALIGLASTLWAGVLVLASGLFDLWDGAIARRLQRVTPGGALLDSVLDRLSEAALFFGLAIFFLREGNNQAILLLMATLLGTVLVSYIKARGEGLGLSCPVGLFTRPERVVVLGVGLILHWLVLALAIIAILSWLTAAQRLIYLWRRAK